MSLRDVHGGRALVLRLVLAELIAKRNEGPLAPRFGAQRRAREAVLRSAGFSPDEREALSEHDKEST